MEIFKEINGGYIYMYMANGSRQLRLASIHLSELTEEVALGIRTSRSQPDRNFYKNIVPNCFSIGTLDAFRKKEDNVCLMQLQ